MTVEELVSDNQKLVYHIINRYYPEYSGDEDLFQIGMIGLWQAAKKWDKTRSKFSSFACTCILYELRKEFVVRRRKIKTISLDDPKYGLDDSNLADTLVGTSNIGYFDEQGFYDSLEPREKIVFNKLKLKCDPKQIAKDLGIGTSRVNQLIRIIGKKGATYFGD